MSEATIFYGLKMLHIGALIFWLGPSLGAWWLLRGIRKYYADDDEVTVISHKLFVSVLAVEHLAFFVLLISGAAMAIMFNFYQQAWLQWKILVIVVLLLPLEIADIYWGNIKLANLLKTGQCRENNPMYRKALHVYHTLLTNSAIVLVPVSVLFIFYLVVARPTLPFLSFYAILF